MSVDKGIIGFKLGMTQVFDDAGRVIPVTAIEAGPCVVVQKKNIQKDGYDSIQVGFGTVKPKAVSKPVKGHYEKAGLSPVRYLREFRLKDAEKFKVGDQIKADIFSEGEYVDITGTSRGKGFAGVIKRWGFRRGPMAHGSKYHRGPGSLQSRDASRVFKGRKMPGRLGGERVTVQRLKIAKVDPDRNLILVKGAVPGPNGSLVVIKNTVKAR